MPQFCRKCIAPHFVASHKCFLRGRPVAPNAARHRNNYHTPDKGRVTTGSEKRKNTTIVIEDIIYVKRSETK